MVNDMGWIWGRRTISAPQHFLGPVWIMQKKNKIPRKCSRVAILFCICMRITVIIISSEELSINENIPKKKYNALKCRPTSYFIFPHKNWIIDTRAPLHRESLEDLIIIVLLFFFFYFREIFILFLAMINGDLERLWKVTWRFLIWGRFDF